MKNILYIGNYKSSSGWGLGAREYLESLLLTEHNVVARPIYLCNNIDNKISKSIQKSEEKKLDKHPDIIIQHVLPDLLEKHEGYNIGIFYTETRNNWGWSPKINLMDEVWVNSELEKQTLIDSGVTTKISIIPVSTNTKNLEKYLRFAEDLKIPELNQKYVFYFIGEHNDRKNILALLKAFHREFSIEEQVSILIKTNSDAIKQEVNEWKKYSRTRTTYLPEAFMIGQLKEQEIYSIHKTCNCFVCPSRGESQCRPIVDAMFFDKPVICTENIFAASSFGTEIATVKSTEVPVDTKSPPVPHIYTGRETWMDIDIIDLQRAMRFAFNNKKQTNTKQWVIDNFSRESVAKRMELCLSLVN